MVRIDEQKKKDYGKTFQHVWQRSGTGRAKELKGTVPTPAAVGPQSLPAASRPGRPTGSAEANRPVALHTHSYTYVFNRLSHHTHRTQLQRAFCAGLNGAPPAEPNRAFYTELDEQLRLQNNTLAAVRDKLVLESLAASSQETVDTVAMREAVNSSLMRQMEFFTGCMAQYFAET